MKDEDAEFLRILYASTREEELAVTGWSDVQKQDFCGMQFDAQTAHYREHYPAAEYAVIECDGNAAGRLYVNRGEREIRIMDLALLPEWRGKGIGTSLLRELQEEAATRGMPLSIHVERFNPALRLYERLGFRAVEDRGVYYLLSWKREG
ncbi:MAG TPA: GNAT family N-acetyltransferase [Luteolibacter sp.]